MWLKQNLRYHGAHGPKIEERKLLASGISVCAKRFQILVAIILIFLQNSSSKASKELLWDYLHEF
jgi:hypothetical protein